MDIWQINSLKHRHCSFSAFRPGPVQVGHWLWLNLAKIQSSSSLDRLTVISWGRCWWRWPHALILLLAFINKNTAKHEDRPAGQQIHQKKKTKKNILNKNLKRKKNVFCDCVGRWPGVCLIFASSGRQLAKNSDTPQSHSSHTLGWLRWSQRSWHEKLA